MTRLCAVSVDLDEVGHYFAIHGLRGHEGGHVAYERGVPRMVAFAEERGISLDLFAVGGDLEWEGNARLLAEISRRGHVVENHSFGHRYDLTRLSAREITWEIEEGARIIEAVTGRRPTGFRAPGYTVNDVVFSALEAVGVEYDSSVFPCPAYYFAKAAMMGGMRIRGRESGSVLDSPKVLRAPVRAYRPGEHWYSRARGEGRARSFVELPIQVTRGARLPFIGTMVGGAGVLGATLLAKACVGEPLVNLELHAMDFLEVEDGLSALLPHQPELRTRLSARLSALSAALAVLVEAGYRFVHLHEAARALS
jgi:peptidoglycan/xylan/chitin deacetylase (PgdA/CDA1 family)